MHNIQKTVFLSYRRANFPWALSIFQNLTQHGYDVFFDFVGIASGDFERFILESIRARAHFLVLLTPSALERCAEPGDWLRREIEAAFAARRNIVPLMLEGFDFGTPAIDNQIKGTLEPLKRYNALQIPAAYFGEAMQRLRDRYLNIPLDAVPHPPSLFAEQNVKSQQAAAGNAPLVQRKELSAQEWFGVPKDDAQAVSWYRKAAAAGEPRGMNNLGVMYGSGRAVPKDDAKAVSLFRKAADAGNARGMSNLGFMYTDGRGVPKDDAQAVSWFRKAADAGNARGMSILGFMYMEGLGVPKDDAQAVSWFRKAADAGDALGMNNLGVMYESGRGVPKDDAQAVSWFRKAADAGDALGMNNLGVMYADGQGVPKDDAQAVSWFRKAADAGNENAAKAVERLRR
jgi:TPR repeat protein